MSSFSSPGQYEIEMNQRLQAENKQLREKLEKRTRTARRLAVFCAVLFLMMYSNNRNAYIETHLANATLPVKVSFDAELSEYHSLGRDIVFSYECNGKSIYSGDTVLTGKKLNPSITITELDNSTDDTGRKSFTFTVPPYSGKTSASVTVHENGGGGHSGSATWDVTCSYRLKINPIKIIFYRI